MTAESKEYIFLGLENPLLDISAVVDPELLTRYGLKANDAILAGPEHKELYPELMATPSVEYVAGGATQNSMRGAQWMLPPKSTIFLGCVGADQQAEQLRAAAAKDGLRTEYLVDETLPTGLCGVLITGHDRSLVTDLMAANAYKIEHLRQVWEHVERAQYYYISGFFLTVSPPSALEVARHAAEQGKHFATNLSAPFISQFFKNPLLELLPYCDLVFGNETEAEAFATANGLASTAPADVAHAIAQLPKKSTRPRVVVITQGSQATIVAVGGADGASATGAGTYPVPPVNKAEIVDTNGAGDAFVGGFMSAYIKGEPLARCVEAGHYVAGVVIRRSGPTYPDAPPTFV